MWTTSTAYSAGEHDDASGRARGDCVGPSGLEHFKTQVGGRPRPLRTLTCHRAGLDSLRVKPDVRAESRRKSVRRGGSPVGGAKTSVRRGAQPNWTTRFRPIPAPSPSTFTPASMPNPTRRRMGQAEGEPAIGRLAVRGHVATCSGCCSVRGYEPPLRRGRASPPGPIPDANSDDDGDRSGTKPGNSRRSERR